MTLQDALKDGLVPYHSNLAIHPQAGTGALMNPNPLFAPIMSGPVGNVQAGGSPFSYAAIAALPPSNISPTGWSGSGQGLHASFLPVNVEGKFMPLSSNVQSSKLVFSGSDVVKGNKEQNAHSEFSRGETSGVKHPHQDKHDSLGTSDCPAEEGTLIIPASELENWQSQLQDRVIIGLCHGARPSLEALRSWIDQTWTNRNIKVNQVQYLPNGYYLFFCSDSNSALQIVGQGQWLVRFTPISVFKWFPGFNPKGPKPTKAPVWVDFLDLPIELYPWLKSIGGCVGKVLGQRPRGGINPKFDPQLLIEVDTNVDLKLTVPIKDSNGKVLHSQKVMYRNLPNACFNCMKQGHYIKDCPESKAPPPQATVQEKSEDFQPAVKKTAPKNPRTNKPSTSRNKNSFSPLLEDVFDPLDCDFSNLDNQGATHSAAQQEDTVLQSSPVAQIREEHMEELQGKNTHFPLPDSPAPKSRGMSSDSSSDGEDVSIPNTQKGNQPASQDDIFEMQLQAQDEGLKAQLTGEEGKSLEILMTQAEEERLPGPVYSHPKRKKEASKDPARLSVVLAKPSKSSKK